jgi:hypothetical protein
MDEGSQGDCFAKSRERGWGRLVGNDRHRGGRSLQEVAPGHFPKTGSLDPGRLPVTNLVRPTSPGDVAELIGASRTFGLRVTDESNDCNRTIVV